MISIEKQIQEHFAFQAEKSVDALVGEWGLKDAKFFVAGGCLIRKDTDVDIFQDPSTSDEDFAAIYANQTPVFESKNARTFLVRGRSYQFCKYKKNSLTELLNSFDFSHCQVGASVQVSQGVPKATAEFTQEFVWHRMTGRTRFVGSEYPLSSLMRVSKYYASGMMTRGEAMSATLSALSAVTNRRFRDYNDFKDQMDAVDLGLLPEDIRDITEDLDKLFSSLNS